MSELIVKEEKGGSRALDIFERKIGYEEKEFYETRSKNLIGKKCLIKSSNNIEICDHAILQQRIILRGDLAKVSIGTSRPTQASTWSSRRWSSSSRRPSGRTRS